MSAIRITLPDTREVRALLLQLGGHLADDFVPFCDEVEEPGDASSLPRGSTPAAMSAAADEINAEFLRAMGLAGGEDRS